jgi:hypothetical protein
MERTKHEPTYPLPHLLEGLWKPPSPWKPCATSREHPQGQPVTNHTEDKRRWALLSRTTLWALGDRVPSHWQNSWHALSGWNCRCKNFTAPAIRPKARMKFFFPFGRWAQRGTTLSQGLLGFLTRFHCTIVPAASRTFGQDKRSTFDNKAISQSGRQKDEFIGRKFPKRQPDELVYDLLFSVLQTQHLCLVRVSMIVLC